jgi:hypothetical protein
MRVRIWLQFHFISRVPSSSRSEISSLRFSLLASVEGAGGMLSVVLGCVEKGGGMRRRVAQMGREIKVVGDMMDLRR